MGFDLGGAVNGMADWACNSPVMRTLVGNPLMAAILIVVIIALIAMIAWRKELKLHPSGRKIARVAVYALIATLIVVYVHWSMVERVARMRSSNKDAIDVFDSVHSFQQGVSGGGMSRNGGGGNMHAPGSNMHAPGGNGNGSNMFDLGGSSWSRATNLSDGEFDSLSFDDVVL